MNVFLNQHYNYLLKKKNQGFTLLELLIVVVILGVLSALSLPSLLRQVGSARTSEAKSILGIVNRNQQAHRLEYGTFGELGDYYLGGNPALGANQVGLDTSTLTDGDGDGVPDNQLAVTIRSEYYEFTDGRNITNIPAITSVPQGVVDGTIAEAFAVSIGQFQNDILDYAAQVTQDANGNFSSIICEESQLNAAANGGTGPVGNGSSGSPQTTACASGNVVR